MSLLVHDWILNSKQAKLIVVLLNVRCTGISYLGVFGGYETGAGSVPLPCTGGYHSIRILNRHVQRKVEIIARYH